MTGRRTILGDGHPGRVSRNESGLMPAQVIANRYAGGDRGGAVGLRPGTTPS